MLAERVICLVIGYAFGLIQTGYFYSKKKGFDLRSHGSGNTGATNTLRTMGVKAGIFVLCGDALKAIVACLLVRAIYGGAHPDAIVLLQVYAGAGVVLGHDFPCYLKFKGGKGMSSTVGMILGSMPVLFPFVAVVFLVPVGITKYVSLGSILGYISFPIFTFMALKLGWIGLAPAHWAEVLIIICLLAALAIYQHRANVVRLLQGKENKFWGNKPKES